jgi:hypothetical protein
MCEGRIEDRRRGGAREEQRIEGEEGRGKNRGFKGIVSRDFGGLQMILIDRA